MASHDKHTYRLQELGGSDFEIADGQPDIRGWEVKNSTGQKIGEVDELIFDAQTRKVRYMVVDLDDNDDLDLDDREVLIPIGLAELHREDDDVILNGVTLEQIRSLPEYDEDNIGADMERAVCSALGRNVDLTSQSANEEFYRHEHFNDKNLYRNRRTGIATDITSESIHEMKDDEGYRLRSREVEGNKAETNDYVLPTRSEENLRREVESEESMLVNRNHSEATDESRLRNERDEIRRGEDRDQRDRDRKERDERTGNTGL